MSFSHPRRTIKTTSSAMTPSSTVTTNMSLRKGATFHSPASPLSELPFNVPSLPRRSQTTLEDVIEAHKRRVALTLDDIERGLSSVNLGTSPPSGQSFQDDSLPVPQGFLNHTVATSRSRPSRNMTNDNTEVHSYNVGGRSLRPRRRQTSGFNRSDSGSSIMSASDNESMSTGVTSVSEDRGVKPAVAASAIARSAAASTNVPRLSERATNKIQAHILRPLLSKASLKDFHPLLEDVPRRIHDKEIVCLRDLEKTLIFMAPEKSKTAHLYLDFCITSIRCIQATVEFLHEREQTRPTDRPYTNGYFVDLVDQIRSYAQQVQATKEKEANGEELDEMDAEPTDQVKLYGGLTKNGRPAELVRVKKNGKAVSIATGLPIKLESIEDDEKGGVMMKRSLSEEAADDEAILRSMARRKRSASAQELAPKVCREPGCSKEFKRSCDLTKHEKTHSRPWKCSEKSCKYHEYGWPTEKELDRHVNDKHSDAPVLYKCHFHPCPYKSKRDSNCKQHMEKAHGWHYIRSKNNGKNRSKNGGSVAGLPTPQTMNHRTPESDFPDTTSPDGDEQEMDFNDYHPTNNVNFNQTVFSDDVDFPEYPSDAMMYDPNIEMQPFISPVETNVQSHSSAGTSPFLDSNNPFGQMNNVTANFGQDFASGNDFTLFEQDDIYNARVQLPPTPPHVYNKQQEIDAFISNLPLDIPNHRGAHISPLGQGNQMLYTPPTNLDDSFEFDHSNNQLAGDDFQLFANAHNHLAASAVAHQGGLFGEVPSSAVPFSQNTQEFFAAFYNPVSTNTNMVTDWQHHDEPFVFTEQ